MAVVAPLPNAARQACFSGNGQSIWLNKQSTSRIDDEFLSFVEKTSI